MAATTMAAALVVACEHPASTTEHACSDTQALSEGFLTGTSLPPKTLALTFDDGPGRRTSELSTFLKDHGIRAAFFINGKMVDDVSVLAQLVADGHIIGNHTQNHLSITGRSTSTARLSDSTILDELVQTDAIIAPYSTSGRFMFRAPFGDYDPAAAGMLNATPMSKYVGSIGWDIGDHMGPHQAVDWDCWQLGNDGIIVSVATCRDLYLQEIDAVGRGVILFHDPYFIHDDPAQGGTVDMIEQMVPILESKGYSFVRADEIPDVAALLPALPPPDETDASTQDSGPDADSSASDAGTASGSDNPQSGTTGISPSTETPGGGSPPRGEGSHGGKPDPCSPSPQQNNAK